MKRIDKLERRVSKIENNYQETEKSFDKLVDDCTKLDEFLRDNNSPKPEMQLLRAYLQQYEDERTLIQKDIEYSKNQINNLKNDFEDGLYDAAQREEYLASEENVLDVIEAKLEYFLDRFKKQSDFIKKVEKQ